MHHALSIGTFSVTMRIATYIDLKFDKVNERGNSW